jgi:hypothetical protein
VKHRLFKPQLIDCLLVRKTKKYYKNLARAKYMHFTRPCYVHTIGRRWHDTVPQNLHQKAVNTPLNTAKKHHLTTYFGGSRNSEKGSVVHPLQALGVRSLQELARRLPKAANNAPFCVQLHLTLDLVEINSPYRLKRKLLRNNELVNNGIADLRTSRGQTS